MGLASMSLVPGAPPGLISDSAAKKAALAGTAAAGVGALGYFGGPFLAAGLLSGVGGAYLTAQDEAQRKARLAGAEGNWLPNPDRAMSSYFSNLLSYEPTASYLSDTLSSREMAQALRLREESTPGINAAIAGAIPGAADLAAGRLDEQSFNEAMRGAGANAFGRGFGGVPGQQALAGAVFGANASLRARETGAGLLSAMLGLSPRISAPSAASFLTRGVMTPEQQTQLQMQVRQQNLAIESQLAQMKGKKGVWGSFLGGLGGMLTGGALGGFGGGFGGGGGGGGSPYGNPTPGYQGMSGGAAYYDVPVTYGTYGGDNFGDHNA